MLIGYGQVNHRGDIDAETVIEPIDLMAAAAKGKPRIRRCSGRLDSIRVVRMLVVHYRARALLGEQIKADLLHHLQQVGGNMLQSLVNRACLDIQRGRGPAWYCWLA